MSEEQVEIVRRAFAAFNNADMDALVALCDEAFHIDMSERVFNPAVYDGHDGIRRFYAEIREVWATYWWEAEELIEMGDYVVTLLRSGGRGRGSGLEVEHRSAMVWTVREGRAKELRFFRDRGLALKATAARLDVSD